MLKRYLVVMLITAGLGIAVRPAAAQGWQAHAYVRPQPGLSGVTAIFKRSFVPVHVRQVEGPAVVEAGQPAAVVARANGEAASLPLRTRWDFGDGHAAEGLAASHRFTEPGTYRVLFTISNESSEAVEALTVRVVPATEAPPEQEPAEAGPPGQTPPDGR